jgi:hypothetical protein
MKNTFLAVTILAFALMIGAAVIAEAFALYSVSSVAMLAGS